MQNTKIKLRDFISIHALVKRATGRVWQAWKAKNHFNPRPREEGDQGGDIVLDLFSDFNPRPREEGDLRAIVFKVGMTEFQSTPS